MRGPERSGDPAPLSQILASVLRGRAWSSGMVLGELGRRWASVVGERLAEECHPARLDGGVLFVRVSSGAWAAQLGFLAKDVRDRANGVLGADSIREVKILVGRPRGRGQREGWTPP